MADVVDWEDIHFFHEVARCGSFSAAAAGLGTTQATVSRRIKALEANLGVALFRRGNSGSSLTEEGRRLAACAAGAGECFEALAQVAQELAQQSRTIVITCGPLVGFFLTKRLAALHAGLDTAQIELKTTNEFLDLEKGEADIALRNKRPGKGRLKSKKFSAQSYGAFSVYGSEKFFERQSVRSRAALARYAWAGYTSQLSHLPTARWLSEHVGERAIRFRMSSASLFLEAIADNEALAVLPCFIGDSTPGLVEVYGPVKELFFDLWIVRRSSSDTDESLLRVIGNLEAVLRAGLAGRGAASTS